ncbi:MAG: AAA family ATPase [Gammaproteobacteria bacterium]
MYDNHFGLKETPFTIAPDPRFLYMSERHREALAHLVYGFETDGGFVLLSGEVGTGKTTISRCLLEQLPDNSSVAMVLNPKLSAQELLATICDELHIEYPKTDASLKTLVDCINKFLLENNSQGRKTVVILEEAQNLEMEVLEQLRLLTNLETNQRKLLQIIMIGQPELLQLLARPELRQLEQRITARYHLLPLSKKDTIDYVKHRLEVAGVKEPVFSYSLLKKIYNYTGGIPRKINLLCDRAMLGAYVQNQKHIDRKILTRAAKEVFGTTIEAKSSKPFWSPRMGAMLAIMVLIAAGIFMVYSNQEQLVKLVSNIQFSSDKEPDPALDESGALASVESMDFLQLLDAQTESVSKNNAFQALFSLRKVSLEVGENDNPCALAPSKGLGCLEQRGNLQSLLAIDRPAVLRFLAGNKNSVYATLVTLESNSATMLVGNKQVKTSLVELQTRWFGDYTVLWRIPPNYDGAIKVGTNGPDVQWLASQLANISGTSDLTGIVSYDAKLIRKVKEFQAQEGLRSDGIAGAKTLIRINSVTANDIPRLSVPPALNTIPDKQSASALGDDSRIMLARSFE